MRRKFLRSLVACTAIAAFSVPAHATTPSCVKKAPPPLQNATIPSGQPCLFIVAGPAAQSANYANPVVVVPRGTLVGFANADIAFHDVRAGTQAKPLYGPDTPECAALNISGQRKFPVGGCPLFWSLPLSGAGFSDVFGLENIPVSTTPVIYDFYCTFHALSAQAGKLAIIDPPS